MLALHDLKFNIITFLEALVTFGLDRAEVNEHIWPIVTSNEPVAFCIVKPLYFTFEHLFPRTSSLWPPCRTAFVPTRKPLISKD